MHGLQKQWYDYFVLSISSYSRTLLGLIIRASNLDISPRIQLLITIQMSANHTSRVLRRESHVFRLLHSLNFIPLRSTLITSSTKLYSQNNIINMMFYIFPISTSKVRSIKSDSNISLDSIIGQSPPGGDSKDDKIFVLDDVYCIHRAA